MSADNTSNQRDSTEVYSAEMESARNLAEDDYFRARPNLMRNIREQTLFRAGFERAFKLLWDKRLAHETGNQQLTEAHAACWAMAEDGWLFHGVEGMSPAQQLVSDYTEKYSKGSQLKASAKPTGNEHRARVDCDGTNCKGHPFNCYGHPHNCGCTQNG